MILLETHKTLVIYVPIHTYFIGISTIKLDRYRRVKYK